MLVHLDRNRLCLQQTKESELYQLMLSIANHTLGIRVDPRRPEKSQRLSADEEVADLPAFFGPSVTGE